MKKRMLLVTLLVFLLTCSQTPPPTAGVTETGNATVKGKVMRQSGGPASGASVSLISASYEPSVGTTTAISEEDIITVKADQEGEYLFKEKNLERSINKGIYNLQAIDSTANQSFFDDSLVIEDSTFIDRGADTLKKPGNITGTVLLPGQDDHSGTLVFIGGSSYLTISSEIGEYTLSDVPEGSYSLTYLPLVTGFERRTVHNVKAVPDSIVETGTVLVNHDVSGAPARPEGLCITYDTLHQQAVISWLQNVEADVVGYVVTRALWDADSNIASFVNIAMVIDTFYTDTAGKGPEIGNTYAYRIAATDSQQLESDFSKRVAVTFIDNAILLGTIHAGHDTVITVRDSLLLQATVQQGTVPFVQYEWDLNGNGTMEYTDTTNQPIWFVAPALPDTITAVFQVQTWSGSALRRDTVIITVLLDPPQVDAGTDTLAYPGDTLVLNGTATDSFGSIIEYAWDTDANGILDRVSATSGSLAYVVPGCTCTKALVFAALDDDSNRIADTLLVTVLPPPDPANLIVNGDFSDSTNGWLVWEERGNIEVLWRPTHAMGHVRIQGDNHNGGVYQTFRTAGVGIKHTVNGWWESDPHNPNEQWGEVLIINGPRLPQDGEDITSDQSDVDLIYKNDTYTATDGWSGNMADNADVTNVGSFVAADTIATIILKSGNMGVALTGTEFDNIVVKKE